MVTFRRLVVVAFSIGLSGPAGAGPPSSSPRAGPDVFGRTAATHSAARAFDSLRSHDAQRNFRAGVRLRELHRDAERRTAARRLRRQGSVAQLRAYRAQLEAQDAADKLRVRIGLAEADGAWWQTLGPHTRRVFERSNLVVRRLHQRRELQTQLDTLEREDLVLDRSAPSA